MWPQQGDLGDNQQQADADNARRGQKSIRRHDICRGKVPPQGGLSRWKQELARSVLEADADHHAAARLGRVVLQQGHVIADFLIEQIFAAQEYFKAAVPAHVEMVVGVERKQGITVGGQLEFSHIFLLVTRVACR